MQTFPIAGVTAGDGGGKAAGLHALVAAGLPVPQALVLPASTYAATVAGVALPSRETPLDQVEVACRALVQHLERWQPPQALREELTQAMSSWGGTVAVRSSASCEDGPAVSTAGVFHSTLGVSAVKAMGAAIGACWSSLWSPLSWAVLRAAGRTPHDETMAVIVQRQIAAVSAGLLLSRDLHQSEALRIEYVPGLAAELAQGLVEPQTIVLPRNVGAPPPSGAGLPEEVTQQLRQLALRCEELLGVPRVELEWAWDGKQLWLLQARAPSEAPSAADTLSDGVLQRKDTCWRWDSEHNPKPLSPAHADLVALLNEGQAVPSLAVLGGYLYEADAKTTTGREAQPPADANIEQVLSELALLLRETDADVPTELAARIDEACRRFALFHRRYADELRPLRARARDAVSRTLAESGIVLSPAALTELSLGHGHASLARSQALASIAATAVADPELARWIDHAAPDAPQLPLPAAIARFLAEYGTLAPRWDVAEPTLAERPVLLRQTLQSLRDPSARQEFDRRIATQRQAFAQAAQRVSSTLDAKTRASWTNALEQLRRAHASAENDDDLFARALWLVRQVLLEAGQTLVDRAALGSPDEVFNLPLARIRAALRQAAVDPSLHSEALAAAKRWRQQSRQLPPQTIAHGQPIYATPPQGTMLNGIGLGGVARGRARVVREASELLTVDLRGSVLVCPTLLPSLAIVLPQIAALVTDHGGALSHAALLARELGIAGVVGTRWATQTLDDGDELWIDGARGCVVRLKQEP